MKPEDQCKFAGLMVKMAIAHRMKTDDNAMTVMLEIYWEALQDISMILFERASARAIREVEWFPKVAELRKLSLEESRKPLGFKEISGPIISREDSLGWIRKINAALQDEEQKPTAAQIRRAATDERKRVLREQSEKLRAAR